MRSLVRPLLAEFIGTFTLVFIGCGAVVIDAARGGVLGLIGIALAHAIALSVMVTAMMNISGGHCNPAVTFALWSLSRIDLRRAVQYIGAQLAAAVVAALAVRALYPAGAGEAMSYGLPRLGADVSLTEGIVIEAILTFFLVSAVFGTCVSPDAPKVGGFGIGLVLLFDILAGGPLTGAAMNPARAFGPAVASLDWLAHAVYWIGPLLGASAAAVVWGKVLLPLQKRE